MPAHPDHCAADETLQQLLLGLLPRQEVERLEQHVLSCSVCGERLAGIEAEDLLTDTARAQATLPDDEDEAEAERLIDRLCRLPMPAVSLVPGQQSAPGSLDALPLFLAPAESPAELGRIGGYRVLKILGSGGMGIVLEAEDTQLGRRVALKVMKPALAASPAAKARFLREARAAAAVEHDNVVAIHQVGEQAGLPYLAMPLLNGESLASRLARQSKLPVAETVRIGRQIARGLAAAHRQGVVHRDVKPDNVWLEAPDCRVKILDFGLARVVDEDVSLTQTGAVAGTPAYMSPEQARGESVDHRADLFSLGCVLYRLSTGESPFSGATAAALLLAVTQKEPPPLKRLAPDAPPDFAELVGKLLRKEAGRRPQSAEEVVSALEAIEKSMADPLPSARRRRRWTGPLVAMGIAVTGLVVLAAMVVRVATDRGTVVLDLKDPEATVTVDGKRTSIQLKDGLVQLTLPSGGHDMVVVRDGFKAYTNHFFVERGGRVPLEVRLEPLPPPEPAAKSLTTENAPAIVVAQPAAESPPNEKEIAFDLGPSVKLELLRIPAGEFEMGPPDPNEDAPSEKKSQRRVHIIEPFYLGKYPVTQEQWQAVMGNNPAKFKGPKNPVEQVSWDDCQKFLDKLNSKFHPPYTGSLSKGERKFRLPTEAQWEYACRAGSTTRYYYGDDEASLGDYAWYSGNSGGRTHPVGQKKPNAWGLYDMHGNVWQWCIPWHGPEYYTFGNPKGWSRILCGGSWRMDANSCRSATRGGVQVGSRTSGIGLRVGLALPDK